MSSASFSTLSLQEKSWALICTFMWEITSKFIQIICRIQFFVAPCRVRSVISIFGRLMPLNFVRTPVFLVRLHCHSLHQQQSVEPCFESFLPHLFLPVVGETFLHNKITQKVLVTSAKSFLSCMQCSYMLWRLGSVHLWETLLPSIR